LTLSNDTALAIIRNQPFLVYLCVPLWLLLNGKGRQISRELMYVFVAAPGFLVLWAWVSLGHRPTEEGLGQFLLGSAMYVPVIFLTPVLIAVALISFWYRRVHQLPSSRFSFLDISLISIMVLGYCYGYLMKVIFEIASNSQNQY